MRKAGAKPRGRKPRAAKRAAARKPRARSALRTVKVPAAIEPLFLKAQDYVSRYFATKVENPELGTISISGERYILLRAASASVEFFDLVMSLYQEQGASEARSVASNLLFDMAHAIGKADAKAFHKKMGVTDPIEKLSAGPIHFSFSGWAFVDISPESRPTPDEEYFLIYDHPFSFESDTWIRSGRKSAFPVCVMNAGYSSGWCEESFGLPLVATEIECLASGGRHCRFIMAPPSRIEAHLARHTRERTAALVEANELLRREIAERKRAEEVRDEFLSVAAHELKTPLTSLRGFSQLLLSGIDEGRAPDAQRLKLALGAIDRQSEKLAQLVSQLLDISRLQAGRLELDRRATDVVPLIKGIIENARATTTRHTISLKAPAAAQAFVDPLRLEQVLTNLLDNAIKYSPEGGPIEVAVELASGALQIDVADRGIGVPPQHRERIFDRFYQAHGERRFGGMGLGLYISRQIVELHGGVLKAEYPRAGGTWVILRVPVDGETPP